MTGVERGQVTRGETRALYCPRPKNRAARRGAARRCAFTGVSRWQEVTSVAGNPEGVRPAGIFLVLRGATSSWRPNSLQFRSRNYMRRSGRHLAGDARVVSRARCAAARKYNKREITAGCFVAPPGSRGTFGIAGSHIAVLRCSGTERDGQ